MDVPPETPGRRPEASSAWGAAAL